jgi:uncharacterized protein YegL
MNPDSPIDPRSALESSLTALLLGELPHEQAAALHQKLAQDAELAKLYERLKHTINLVRETIASPAEQVTAPLLPLRLEERRRQKLLQHFKTVAPKEFAQPRGRRTRRLIEVALAAAVVLLLASIAVPNLVKSRTSSLGSYWSMSRLGRDSESEPSAMLAKSADEAHNRNVRRERYASESASHSVITFSPPPAASAPPLPNPVDAAIVLPKSTELADATTPSPVTEGVQEAWKESATLRGFYDDSPAQAGGVEGGVAGGRSGGSAIRNTWGAEGRPVEVADANSFFRQSEALGVVDAGKTVKNDGRIQASGKPSIELGFAESPLALGTQAGGVGKGLSLSRSQLKDTPPNQDFALRQAYVVLPGAAKGPVKPTTPAVVPPPDASAPTMDLFYSTAAPAPTPAPATPAFSVGEGLEIARVPLQAHAMDRTAGDLVVNNSGRVPSRQSAEVGKGAELLREPAAPASRSATLTTGLPAPTASYYGGGAYGGYSAISGGTGGGRGRAAVTPAPSTPQETAVNDAGYLQVERLTSGRRSPGAPLPAQGGTASKAGQPLPGGKISNQLLAQDGYTPSDTSKEVLDSPVVEGSLKALPDLKTAKGEQKGVPVVGFAVAGQSRSEGQAFRYGLAPNPATAAGEPAGSSAGTANFGAAAADVQGLNYQWYYDANGDPSPATSEGNKVPILGDVPAAGRFYRLNGDEVAGKGKAKVEEKLKSVELAYGEDQDHERQKSVAEGEPGRAETRGANVYNLDVVGYANAPVELKNAVTVNARKPAPSSIALPTKPGETRLALNDTSSADQKSRPYFEAKRSLEELQRFRQVLDMKIASEKIDVELPKTMMVEVVDKAVSQPAQSPALGERIRGALGGKVERSARVKVERDQSDIAGPADVRQVAGYDPYFIQTEFETIQSGAVLGKVIKELNLNEAWGKEQGGRTLTTAETMALLKNKLDLRTEQNASLINIGVKSDKPEEAARIANAVAEAYKQHRSEQRAQLSKGGIKALEERFQEQEGKVRLAQANVDRLRKELNISDGMASGDGPSPLMTADTLRKLEGLRIESKAELVREQTLLSRLKEFGKEQGTEKLAQAIPSAASDSLLSSLLEQLTVAEQRLVTLEKEYGPTHPDVLKCKAIAEDLHTKIKSRVDGIIVGLDAKVLSLSNSLDNLEKEVAKATQIDIHKANQSQKADVAPPKPVAPAPVPQPEVQTAENAFSTFSLNVSDVSFKLAAASLEKGVMPEPATVRSEEFINAFDYRDPEPPSGVPVAFAWERAQYPFAQNRDLLRFSIKTAALGRQPGRSLNLVLLLDNSGSMERADRVRIIREALRVLAGQLQPQDKFSVVTFSRTPRLFADGAPGSDAEAVAMALTELTPQGGTNLEDAMNLAYQTALRHYLANGVNRVVLLTDGAANLGNVDPEALKQKVEANRKQGVALDCFGIGWEGYNDDLLEVLSRNGDGRYGFVNTPEEAATEFAGQLAGALRVAASDVMVQVEFNPGRVTAYRQIGYAKHQLTKQQFRDNTVDAAEIGAAESGNALYVVEVNPRGDGPLGTVRVRYKVPGTSDYHEHEWAVPYAGNAVALEQASPAMRLAAVASAFSEWLVSSPYAAEVTPDRLLGYLSGVPEICGADQRPKKLEWMIRQAKSIAGK